MKNLEKVIFICIGADAFAVDIVITHRNKLACIGPQNESRTPD